MWAKRLWLVPVLVLIVPCLLAACSLPWQAALWDGTATYLIDLPRHPFWDPPSPPPLATFDREFSKSFASGRGEISVYVRNDEAALQTILMILTACLACVPFYFGLRGRQGVDSLPLRVCSFAALGTAGGAAVCFVLWLIAGGWGPPAPVFFGGVGMVAGAIAGFTRAAVRPPT